MTPKKPNLAVSKSVADHEIIFPVLASPKLDGVRATSWGGTAFSRSLKEIPNRHVQKCFARAKLPAPFDGELTVGDPRDPAVFTNSTSGCMSRDGTPDFTFWVFDFVPPNADMRFADRYRQLKERTTAIRAFNPWVQILEHTLVHDLKALHALEQRHLDLGYEGTMLCGVNSLYKHGRSTLREQGKMKRKPFDDAEALVIGYEEQMANMNEAFTNELGRLARSSAQGGKVGKGVLGAFICQDPTTGVQFRLGTGEGLTDELRRQLWEQRDTLCGRYVTYTKQRVGEKDKPRIPVWRGFRNPVDMS